MHFLKSVILLSAAASALVIQRDVAETKANLATVDADVRKLTSDTKAWDGSALGSLGINGDESDLEKAIDNTTSAASDEPVYSSADSQSVLSYVTGTLTPDIKASLDAIVSRKAQFTALNQAGIVHDSLTRLRTKSASLSDALIKSASSDQQSGAQSAKSTIDGYFASALTSYP